ncbi:MAG: hypothetical protein BGO43_04460 [Gammaproteobacteria bacterium 39-13]|nr:hypothetical protein [Gammaproteobacteria bacterium]OJV94935.1 MAG: hypothetical protein BGO43_04460 [Gammaproteobacteria bacterium 39-13]
MPSYKRILLGALFCVTPLTIQASYWSPHIGADLKYWGLEPGINATQTVTGTDYERLFPDITTAYRFYIGSRVNGFFGFDIGYEESTRRQQSLTFVAGDIFFIKPEVQGDAARVSVRLQDFYLDLNFYWEVFKRFEIIFMGGLAFLHNDIKINHLSDGTWLEYRGESEMKAMGRIGIGAQYNIMPCLGIKFLINGDPGIRINPTGFDEDNNWFSITPYKTAISYNLGIVYSLNNPRKKQPPVEPQYQSF